jgi:hypothetical protein
MCRWKKGWSKGDGQSERSKGDSAPSLKSLAARSLRSFAGRSSRSFAAPGTNSHQRMASAQAYRTGMGTDLQQPLVAPGFTGKSKWSARSLSRYSKRGSPAGSLLPVRARDKARVIFRLSDPS